MLQAAGRPALNVLMLGPPGAGKGTQAERLAKTRGLAKISTGDILREAVQAGTKLGNDAKAAMEAGNLVGDDVMIGIVRQRLEKRDAKNGFVLDGFPRTVVQAGALDQLMDRRGPLVVLNIVVPEEVLVRRLAVEWIGSCGKCGGALVARVDDSVDIVRERLKVYQRQTKPLVDYYSARPTFRAIDGNQPPNVVTGQIDAALEAAAAGSARL
jgi:adenylate kinase